MAQLRKGTGIWMASGVTLAAITLAVMTTMAGDVNLRFAGVEIQMQKHSERGLVINIEGVECPGTDCPAFALDWNTSARG